MSQIPDPHFSQTSRFSDRLVFLLSAALLLLAPIIRGGNRQLAMTVLLGLGLALLAVLLARMSYPLLPVAYTPVREASAFGSHVERVASQPAWWWTLVALVAASPLWLGVLQLTPLSADLWSQLAGRESYLGALAATGATAPTSLPLSLQPAATWTAMWSALPLTAMFLAALQIDKKSTDKLLILLMFVGIAQMGLSVLQFTQGPKSPLYFGTAFPGQRFIGTFNSKNSLADFFAMLIPVWFYILVAQGRRPNQDQHRSLMSPAVFRPLWLFIGFSLLVLLLSTQSRGGLFASSVVLVLSCAIYMASLRRELGLGRRIGIAALLGMFILAVLVSVGTEGISKRLKSDRLQTDSEIRNTYAEATFRAAGEFWPWGSGMGSFESVFPRFQELRSTGFVEYAHNDYPQLLMELGAPALLIAAALLGLVLVQLRRLYKAWRKDGRLSTPCAMRALAGVGVLALLLHSWVEFNMHIPALALTATFLAGAFLRPLQRHEL